MEGPLTGFFDSLFHVALTFLLLIGFGFVTWTAIRERHWFLSSLFGLGAILSGVGVFLVIGGMVGIVDFSTQECQTRDLSRAPIRGPIVDFLGEVWGVFVTGVLTIGIVLAVGHLWREQRYLSFAVLSLVALLFALLFAISVGDFTGLIDLPVEDCPKR